MPLRRFHRLGSLSLAHVLLGGLLILGPVTAQAEIVADGNAAANQRPIVLDAGNGVPLVNIQTPSAAGVSRNEYSQFDVNNNGAILNNGRTDSNTQLSGWVQANPYLATGSARVILNEVNSSDPSRLNGYVEVAGSQAQVIIANPAGISCDGCGFINANRATLSTGTPIVNGGDLQGYRVEQGQISITGNGLSNSTGYTDLIGRAVEVNAGIWSNQINVAAGAGTVNADVSAATSASGTGSAPQVAIDVSQLGGMYANSIRLIGNEAGVGVRNAGQIGIGAGNVVLTADGRIENTGLVNGGNTRLQASTLDNTGTGRVYGDQVSVGANTVNNLGDGTNAPVIAARQQLDIGATTINNREHALLYSGGDMAIGGALDGSHHATGQADTLNNASATINAVGNLHLAARQVNNTDEHLETAAVVIAEDRIVEYGGASSGNHYDSSQIGWAYQDRATYLVTPEGVYHNWNRYDYIRTITETQVITADPGRITAGGNIHVDSAVINNDNSQILAGSQLTTGADTVLNNVSAPAETVTTEAGGVRHYLRGTYCAHDGVTGCNDEDYNTYYRDAGYNTLDSTDFDLGTALASSGNNSTTTLPDSSFYSVNPVAPNGYLIETDPQFANYRQWISSDYMLALLAVDPATTQMRLGDGFYEQQLVREQLADLTGRRFLDNYSDDDAQYIALMDAGVTFAQTHNLRPGIALSAEQVAQLTSDIVWLVEEQRTLPDGTVANVLVPRLYVMVRENGINGRGGLIAADTLRLDMNGDIDNSGTLAGHRVAALSADNINNVRGILYGADVQLDARHDVNNIGGSIRAQDNLNIQAGHDINVVSTTATHTTAQGSRTSIDRIAGLYVNSGSLLANAGHDINLTGAAIVNDSLVLDADRLGNTELVAGNDFMLNSVQEREQQLILWDGASQTTDRTRQTGTRIQTQGDLAVRAGNDLTGTAARLRSEQGNIALQAQRDITLNAGVNETHINSQNAHYQGRSDDIQHNIASLNAGGNISIDAGRNLTLIGTDTASAGDTTLSAEGDTTVSAVVDTQYRYSRESYKGDFGRSKKITDETLASTVSGGTLASGGDLLINAHKNGSGQIISEQSGNVTLIGTQLQSAGDIAIAADQDITVSAIQYNTLDFHQTQTSSMGGLSKTDEGAATTESRLQNAQLASGGNTHLLSGNNLSLIAADVVANGDINLEAVDTLLIAAGQTLSSTEQWKNESGAFTGGHLYEIKEHGAGETVSAAQGSTLLAGGNVTARAGTGRIVGSDIHGEQGVDLAADAGDFSIEAAQTTRSSYVHDKEISAGISVASMKGDAVNVQDGRLTIQIADAHYSESDTESNSTQMRGANVSSGGDISVSASAGSVNVIGSTLAADTDNDGHGDIAVSALQNINITEATDTASTKTKTTTGDAELSIVVQNQAVEVVLAYERLEDAKEALEESKHQYKDYQRNLDQLEDQLHALEQDVANKKPGVNYDDLVELRALISDVKDDKEWYLAGMALAALNLASATTGLVQQVAAAAQSTGTYGFNAGLQLDIDASKTNTESSSTTAVASTLSGQNIRLQTGNGSTQNTQTNIQGSNLLATNNIAINTGDLNVTASKNTYETGTETEHGHVTAQMTVYGASGGASVNASMDRSKNSARSTTYNNSVLLADSIDLTTSGDTTLRGATVRAESELNADIGGNLTVESVQDRSSSKNNSAGISGGISLGSAGESKDHTQGTQNIGGLSGVNGGVNAANGMSNSRQTVLTSLTSGGTANINVQNHTQVTGALIATTDANGNDLNQLNLSTNTINFTDLRDTNVSSQTSAGLSSNVGIGPVKPGQTTAENNTGGDLLPGTTNLSYTNSQQNSASTAMATLGHGNISVGGTALEQNGELTEAGAAENSALAGINRDTTNTTKELWNSDYSQEVDVTIDNRLFTSEGHKAIKEDIERSERLGSAIADVATKESFELQDTLQHIDETQKELDVQKAFALANDGKNIEALQGDGTSVAEKQAAITLYAQIYADTYGINIDEATIIATSKIIGGSTYTNNGTSSIAINDNAQRNALDYADTMGHEVTHARIRQKTTRDREDVDLNEEYAHTMGQYAADGMEFSSQTYNNVQLTAGKTTNTRSRTDADNAILATNNKQWNANIQRANNGEGVMDYRQLYAQEAQLLDATKQRINENPALSNEQKTVMHLQLNAVACAEIKCAEGVPESDAHYDQLTKLEALGNELKASGVSLDVMLGELPEGSFDYDTEDSMQDAITRHDEGLTRGKGAVDAGMGTIGAGVGTVATVATSPGCATVIGCAIPAATAVGAGLAGKQAYDGITAMFGDYSSAEGQRVLNSFSEATHEGDRNLYLDAALNVGLWAGETLLIKKASNLIPDGVVKQTPDTKPNVRRGDGDDAGLKTSLVDGNRVVREKGPENNLVRIETSKSTKGTTEYDILNNAEARQPNTKYELDNGNTFITNDYGQVDELSFTPVNSKVPRDARQTQAGKQGRNTDVGGHAQACSQGGTCDGYNLFPQDANFNNSAYKVFYENKIKKALNDPNQTVGQTTIKFERIDPSSPRPDTLSVTYTINGKTKTVRFENEAGSPPKETL